MDHKLGNADFRSLSYKMRLVKTVYTNPVHFPFGTGPSPNPLSGQISSDFGSGWSCKVVQYFFGTSSKWIWHFAVGHNSLGFRAGVICPKGTSS